jgi:hypothetical protein
MIESRSERRLAPHRANDGAEYDRHPQQRGKGLAEADAGGCGENDQYRHAQGNAYEDLRRSQFSRSIRDLSQNRGLRRQFVRSRLAEMIGIDALIKLVGVRHYDRNAGPGWRRTDQPRLGECAENREREVRVPCFDRAAEPVRQFALA